MIDKIRANLRKRKLSVLKPFGEHKCNDGVSFSVCGYTDSVADSLACEFASIDQVEIVKGDILNLECDALVSPANSFGEMSGGLDRAIDLFYDRTAQKTVVERIRSDYLGELPVGMAVTVQMQTKRFPHLIVAPTMRIPGNVSDSLNAYLAMRAVLVEIARFNRIKSHKISSVAIPSLCTGVGGMSPAESAKQMRVAFDNVALGGWTRVVHPAVAPFASR